MMPRVTHVKKARKAQGSCRVCGKKIKAGDSYKWFQKLRQAKTKYCSKCSIPGSHMAGGRRGEIIGTMEGCVADANGVEDQDTWEGARDNFVSEMESQGEEAEGALENMPEGLQESPSGEILTEYIEGIADWIQEVEGIEFDDSMDLDENKSSLVEAMENCPF